MTITAESYIVHHGDYAVIELAADVEKLRWLWEELQKHRTVFNDFTKHDVDNFVRAVTHPRSLWYEVIRTEDESTVGLIMLNDLEWVTDASGHLIFFDMQPAEKIPLVAEMLKYVFQILPLHRLSVCIPAIHWRTSNMLKKLGFTQEGMKRQAILMGGRFVDQLQYGILKSEVQG